MRLPRGATNCGSRSAKMTRGQRRLPQKKRRTSICNCTARPPRGDRPASADSGCERGARGASKAGTEPCRAWSSGQVSGPRPRQTQARVADHADEATAAAGKSGSAPDTLPAPVSSFTGIEQEPTYLSGACTASQMEGDWSMWLSMDPIMLFADTTRTKANSADIQGVGIVEAGPLLLVDAQSETQAGRVDPALADLDQAVGTVGRRSSRSTYVIGPLFWHLETASQR